MQEANRKEDALKLTEEEQKEKEKLEEQVKLEKDKANQVRRAERRFFVRGVAAVFFRW